ncbi:MAG: D-Ala-D-Ala carboxypeptidase family metallohydrolase [Bacilli bacterium]
MREHFNAPITITSAYRCLTHNSRVGGATGSRHTKGDAADIVVKGVSPKTVAQYAESIGIKGIGLYETSADGFFTHIDTRTTKSFWYG